MNHKYSLCSFLFMLLGFNAFLTAQTKEDALGSTSSTTKSLKTRPSVALVLAGGGARGFVHIPVLEMLEEEGIPVDIVIGNSAGSIIAGLYCAGYKPNKIMQTLGNLKWSTIFQDSVTSPFEKKLGDHSSITTPFALKFINSDNKISLQMGSSLLTGQNAYVMLKQNTIRIPSNIDFNTLPIPFRAVAVNLITGELVIFDHGDMAEAIRASMSIPGLFQPFYHEGNYYVDGLARNNNPIDVAKKMGYDIIIDVDFGNALEDSYSAFETTPLKALTQMMQMGQNNENLENYKLADIVMLPDYGNHSLIDYDDAFEIYKIAQADIERYRPQIKELKNKIDNWEGKTLLPQPNLFYDKETGLYREKKSSFPSNYFDNSNPKPNKIVLNFNDKNTTKYTTNYFNKIINENNEFSAESFKLLSEGIYNTGLYITVTTRITQNENNEILEISAIDKKPDKTVILFGANAEGTLATDSVAEFDISTDFQLRELTGKGSVLSAKTVFLNNYSFELMYMQPIGAHFFIELDSALLYDYLHTGTGWYSQIERKNLLKKTAYFSTTFGVPFSNEHTLTGGAKIAWYDTTDEIKEGSSTINSDFNLNYIFNTLNFNLFPESGAYTSLKHICVVPVTVDHSVPVFGITEIEAIGAIPITHSISLLLSGFAGSNIDQGLLNRTDLTPIYGFTTADRQYFPQIVDRSDYGIHKATISTSLQFAPWDQITLIGGKAYFATSGAIGNVWDSFDSITLKNLEWRASFDTGIRITNGFGIVARIGAGTTQNTVLPFISLDVGNVRF
ncbi:MAG: hypothetical protein BKP49_02135 [Treponema sp. CETP13]|nr:MAG: hypothetical protein BKP49_02135 [Treponema sp. CETP13]